MPRIALGHGAAAHRGQESDFVALGDGAGRRCELLVARGHNTALHLAETGEQPGVVVENGGQGAARLEFQRVLRPPDNVLQDSEK